MSQYSDILAKCGKEWSCPDLMDSVNKTGGRKIPFSSPSLNWATYGGVPRAGITEFYGVPGGGKSTSAVDICKNARILFNKEYEDEIADLQSKIANGKKEYKSQLMDLNERGPKKILYIDLEHSFDKKWAATLGLLNTEIDVMQPPDVSAEAILQKVKELVQTGEVGMIVLDSIPSLVSQKELDKKFGEATVAPVAGLMTIFCREITQILIRYDCTMIFINQLRLNMANPYVDQTPGGEAIKFYSSLRMSFKLGSPLDILGNELPQKTENPAGYLINVQLKKQKSAPFDRKLAQYYLMAKSGLRVDFEFANLAIKRYNIIKKGGAWFTICDPETKEPLEVEDMPVKVNGLSKVYDYLQANPDYYKRMCDYIVNDINKSGIEEDASTELVLNDYS
jgi:recombination protein RecA